MKTGIAILGATGVVGQKAIALLTNHPDFEVRELVASEKNIGKRYGDQVLWRESISCPETISNMELISFDDIKSKFVISALPADIAKIEEMKLAERGVHVVSNASAYRMEKDIPLTIPEINGEHIELIKNQVTSGKIVTNPNCSTVFLAMGLAPLKKFGKIKSVSVVTLQAISGAGHPGIASLDILGNTIPNISGEEEKIEREIKKILGSINSPTDFSLSTHVNRVAVEDGHTIVMHVEFEDKIVVEEVYDLFSNIAQESPQLYSCYSESFSPQPKRDLTNDDYRAHIGRIKCGGNDRTVGLISMGHNLVRGAAGAAIKNLELLMRTLERL
jgi:aspartate-semialdehyde dehydrogenase